MRTLLNRHGIVTLDKREEKEMGYENRLYVVDYKENMNWAEIIAVFNLCKTGYRSTYELFNNAKEVPENFTMFRFDSDEKIEEDCYGRRLTFSSVEDTVKALKDDEEYDHYRRFPPVIAFLESISKEKYQNLIVVNYGY